MAGEQLAGTTVNYRGLIGDRAYAVIDTAANKAATVRTWSSALLNCRPRYVAEFADTTVPDITITMPDGRTVGTGEADRVLSEMFGRELALRSVVPKGLLLEVPAGTVGGKHAEETTFPISAGAPPNTFFDFGSVHLITTSTIDALQSAYRAGIFDVKRFRPNFVVSSPGWEPFCENQWVGKTISIGDFVVLRPSIPCPRCVMMTLPQANLPSDPGILRTVTQKNKVDLGEFGKVPCAGIYAEVVNGGPVTTGATVRINE